MRTERERWEAYLFETHSEAELREWAGRLGLLRFVRASGGHANDADQLLVAYAYADQAELVGYLDFLGVPARVLDAEPAQPVPGQPYAPADYAAFVSLVPGTAWVVQPGHVKVAGRPVFVWAERGRVTLSPHTRGDWEVEPRHVADAEAVEVLLADSPLAVLDPPADRRHCICPRHHPDFFGR